MGKRRNQHPQQLQDNQDSIFAGNPFLDDLLAWRHSPEGEQFAAFSDVLCDVMEQVQLDARQRLFIWPDGEPLDLDQSVARIHQQYPDWRHDWPRFNACNASDSPLAGCGAATAAVE